MPSMYDEHVVRTMIAELDSRNPGRDAAVRGVLQRALDHKPCLIVRSMVDEAKQAVNAVSQPTQERA